MKYPFKTQPWPHQVKAMKFVLRRMVRKGSGGLQVPMRWGKTKVVIDVASALHLKYGISRCLAVTTTSGLGVWEAEIPKHSPIPVIVRNYKGEVVYWTGDDCPFPPQKAVEWLVIHHSILFAQDRDEERDPKTGLLVSRDWWAVPNPLVENFDPEFIVIDESHKIGNPGSEQCKMAYRYGKRARFRMTVTGTSFHRGPLAVFGQMKFLDDSLFGTAITGFRAMYVKFGGFGGYEIKGYRNLEHMADKIKDAVFIQEKPPLKRPPVIATTPIRLEESRDQYRKMEKESAIDVAGKTITAPIILTRHLRCQQIAGGWVKTEDGHYHRVGSEKYRALEDKLTTYMEEGIDKVVIMSRFVPEIRDIARAARVAGYDFTTIHGGVPRGDARTARVARFQGAEKPIVFIGQVQAVAEAIDLSAASVMIWYSLPESYLLYSQGLSRIETYNEQRTLYYDHLIAKGTRDEVTWEAMKHKQDVATFLVKNPRYVELISEREDLYDTPLRFG